MFPKEMESFDPKDSSSPIIFYPIMEWITWNPKSRLLSGMCLTHVNTSKKCAARLLSSPTLPVPWYHWYSQQRSYGWIVSTIYQITQGGVRYAKADRRFPRLLFGRRRRMDIRVFTHIKHSFWRPTRFPAWYSFTLGDFVRHSKLPGDIIIIISTMLGYHCPMEL